MFRRFVLWRPDSIAAPNRGEISIDGEDPQTLDSIRFETHGMTPTLSLIRLVIVRKSSRRGIIIFKEIGAEIGRFQTVGGQADSHLDHSGRFPINCNSPC